MGTGKNGWRISGSLLSANFFWSSRQPPSAYVNADLNVEFETVFVLLEDCSYENNEKRGGGGYVYKQRKGQRLISHGE